MFIFPTNASETAFQIRWTFLFLNRRLSLLFRMLQKNHTAVAEYRLRELQKILLILERPQILIDVCQQISNECLEDWLLRFKGFFYMTEDVFDDLESILLPSDKQQGDDLSAFDQRMLFRKAVPKLQEVINTAAYLLREIEHFKGMETLLIYRSLKEQEVITSSGLPTLPYKVRELKGRATEKAKILKALLHKEGESKESPVLICITGPVGIGKTDLARAVYNSAQIEAEFDVKAWIYMGNHHCDDNWLTIQRSKSASVDQPSKLHKLSGSSSFDITKFLETEMTGKKVLMVLDNLMNCNDLIKWPKPELLEHWAKVGNRIIVTSRFKRGHRSYHLPSYPAALNVELDGLKEAEYLELFKECALGDRNRNKYPELEDIVGEIAKRFGGNPLAAVMIGRHLKCHPNEDRWRAINRSNLATIDSTETAILSVLRDSYEQLPWYVMQLYLACALFPKNYPFEKKQLFRILKAIFGFDSDDDTLSKVSLFVSSAKRNGKLVLHAILHEFADYICDGEFFRLEDEIKLKEVDDIEIPHKAQHVYVTTDNFVKVCRVLQKKTHLRSLVIGGILSSEEHKTNFVELLEEVLRNLKGLRLLMISELPTGKLPDAIGGLTHLRYLELPVDKIMKESVQKLSTWISDNPSAGLRKLINLEELRGAIQKLKTGESSRSFKSIDKKLSSGESRGLIPSSLPPLKFSKDDSKVVKEKTK